MNNSLQTAGILAIGDELVLGQKLDTNSQWLASRLTELGYEVITHQLVPDDQQTIADAIQTLMANAHLVICTGGLGPTLDDLTRQSLADVLNDKLVTDDQAIAQLKAFFKDIPMPKANLAQALRPAHAVCLTNPVGTAPGLLYKADSTIIACLPGPPSEMMPMFDQLAEHHLAQQHADNAIHQRLIHTVSMGESELATKLGSLMDRGNDPAVGTTASGLIVTCRLRTTGNRAKLDLIENQIRQHLGDVVFGVDDQTLPQTIISLLKEQNQCLAAAESCTGGMLGALLTAASGSSDAYEGGWITYTNEMKQKCLGVPADIFSQQGDGAVSQICARYMALGVLKHAPDVHHALAITGIAGPCGATPDKPAGTVWIAHASRTSEPDVRLFHFKGSRQQIRRYACISALAMLHRALTHAAPRRLVFERTPSED